MRADDTKADWPRVEVVAPRIIGLPKLEMRGAAFRHAARLRVRTVDGRTFTREVLHRRGSPENPVLRPDIERKFSASVDGLLNARAQSRLIELCASLENLASVADINQIMAAGF